MDELAKAAVAARERAFAPYSRFRVGAAIEDDSGAIHSGCNIENASYGLTVCAERVAVFSAVAQGARKFRRIAVATASQDLTPPCGACRQVLWDLCGDITVILVNHSGAEKRFLLSELFPNPFNATFLP
jgi:cytidine deaminase